MAMMTASPSLSDNTTNSVPVTPRIGTAVDGHAAKPQGGAASNNMAAPTATPVGGRAFASPAMIRILLTPATSDVTPEQFERMTSAIRRIESIRLSDLPKSTRRGDTVPSTSALARAGEVHITFVTSYDAGHAFLSPFNIHRQVLGVLGLAMCSSAQSVGQLERAPAALRQMHPTAVVHRVFGFDVGAARPQTIDLANRSDVGDEGAADLSISSATKEEIDGMDVADGAGDLGDGSLNRVSASAAGMAIRNSQEATAANRQSQDSSAKASNGHAFANKDDAGLVIFPAVRNDLKDVRFYLKTLIPNFIGDVLDGLDAFVKDLQGKPLETPRETLDGTMASSLAITSVKSLGANVGAAASSAASRASALFSSFSSSEESSSRKTSKNAKALPNVSAIGPTGSGRYAKVKADYYLLIGDLWNALHTYDSCVTQLGKERALAGGQDAVWYASALEGWAVARTLVARMGGMVEEKAPCLTLPTGGVKEKDKVTIDFEFAGKQWSDIAEAYSLALTIYSKCLAPASYLLDPMRSMHNDTPRDYTHPLIHATACMAFARFLLAIWASGGWNGETFDQLLLGGVPPALAETTRPTTAVYMQHTTASGIHRHDIAAPASQSLSNSATNALKILDQIHLFSSLAAIFGCLGFSRKEAYAIQRLQSLVIVLIAQGIQLQRQYGSQTSQALSTGDTAHGTMSTQIMSIGGGHGSDSVLVLALQVCQTYGINVQLTPLFDVSRTHILLRASVDAKSGKRLSTPALNRSRAMWTSSDSSSSSNWQQFDNEEVQARVAAITELLEEAPFGWTEQQIVILKDAIAICEMLQDKTALLFFALIMLRDFWPHLGFEEQFKLKDGVAKIMANMQGQERDILLQYWGPKDILTGVELEAGGVSSMPVRTTFADIQRQGSEPHWAKRQSRQSSGQVTKDVLVQDELASFAVTLYNPLQIPLELESIKLELQRVGNLGPTFEPVERKNVILPPSSLHVLRLGGVARGEGRLCVRGVRIKLPHCAERLFTFEYASGEAEKSLWKAQAELDDRWTRTKRFGLDARGSGSTGQGLQDLNVKPKARSRTQENLWMLSVIAKVPIMSLKVSQPIRAGSLVLCDGEERTVTLTLTNQSDDVSIDHLHFVFDDDMQANIVALLAEGNLDATDVYELERDLTERPFLSFVEQGESSDDVVEPGASKTFVLRIRGKLDVSRASISIHYGNKAQSRDLGRDHLWLRHSSFSFDVRCLPALFLDGLELSALSNDDLSKLVDNASDREEMLKHGACLMSLAAHNAHPGEVEIMLDVQGSRSVCAEPMAKTMTTTTTTRRLPAHASVRLYFVIPRLAPDERKRLLERDIPKLVQRQFIVSRAGRSEEEERIVKATFWLRTLLLERLTQLTWKDVCTRRTGTISTSGLQIDSFKQAAEALFGDRVTLDIKISGEHQERSGQPGLHANANDFIDLIITVRNLGADPIDADYLISTTCGPDNKSTQLALCVNGHLQGRLRSKRRTDANGERLLAPGEAVEVRSELCFLAQGQFNLNVDVRPSVSQQSIKGSRLLLASKGISLHVH